jgi:hypothetical protein
MKDHGQRKISFIVACLLLIFGTRISAQVKDLSKRKDQGMDLGFITPKPLTNLFPTFLIGRPISGEPLTSSFLPRPPALDPQKMPGPGYYMDHLGFFCKKEWEFEKTAHLPLRIRLGSLENCNFLEGKDR